MSSNSQKKHNLRIAKRIPELIYDIDTETINIILKLNEDNKVFVLHYIGNKNPTNSELVSGIDQSIKYYNISTARVVIVDDPSIIPNESSIMKCIMIPLDDVIKAGMINPKEIVRGRKGIHFVASSRINNTGDQASVGFFKPLE